MNEKFYLGISLGFNSSACVVSDKRGLVAAISQERMNGQKNTKELPFDAIAKCIEIAGIREIEQIAISHYETITNEYFKKYQATEGPYRLGIISNWQECILNILIYEIGVKIVCRQIKVVNHHLAHALSTFAFYPSSINCVAITSDGFGQGVSGTISTTMNGPVSEIPLKNSIALVYQFVTGALGFKMHQHEGKITGLAAYGKPIYLDKFEALYNLTDEGNGLDFKDDEYSLDAFETEQCVNSAIIDFDHFLKLKKAVFGLVKSLTDDGAKREDIAASVQEFSEKYTLKWIERYCKSDEKVPAYIAGGLFANVKINQRIKDSGIFSEVYVCPPMGDEGTCVGAALSLISEEFEVALPQLCGTKVGLDTVATVEMINQHLKENNLEDAYNVTVSSDTIGGIVTAIAERLANNKIVCLMRDSMEFGPRALCHRSILYNADSRETNDWLNKKLSRTEFMPFAPVCREEVADDLFINLDGGRDSAKYMTMTFDCTEEFAENYKAACHIDNTARPQIIHFEDDPFMWNVLSAYESLTGKKALINTSFNLHNWPIIESEKVGLESWITSDTDCLVIGNVIVEKK